MEDFKFPYEILLHMFLFLPPKSLMSGRNVSQERRVADITPIRQA